MGVGRRYEEIRYLCRLSECNEVFIFKSTNNWRVWHLQGLQYRGTVNIIITKRPKGYGPSESYSYLIGALIGLTLIRDALKSQNTFHRDKKRTTAYYACPFGNLFVRGSSWLLCNKNRNLCISQPNNVTLPSPARRVSSFNTFFITQSHVCIH